MQQKTKKYNVKVLSVIHFGILIEALADYLNKPHLNSIVLNYYNR